MVKLQFFVTLGLALSAATEAAGNKRPKYKDPSVSVAKRVSDLLSRMTVEEKTAQLMQGREVATAVWPS
jgi:beta-glucosidase